MKRKTAVFGLPIATALVAALLTLAPALQAQTKCYPSYILLSGTCPDLCGRGDDCPCETCVTPIDQT
jgi:hypothetical protein